MLAMTRDMLRVRDNYNVYYRRTAATYKAKSPIGKPPHLHKLVWAWSPYWKIGKPDDTGGVPEGAGGGGLHLLSPLLTY